MISRLSDLLFPFFTPPVSFSSPPYLPFPPPVTPPPTHNNLDSVQIVVSIFLSLIMNPKLVGMIFINILVLYKKILFK